MKKDNAKVLNANLAGMLLMGFFPLFMTWIYRVLNADTINSKEYFIAAFMATAAMISVVSLVAVTRHKTVAWPWLISGAVLVVCLGADVDLRQMISILAVYCLTAGGTILWLRTFLYKE